MRDDQFLVSDRTENKFYGTLLLFTSVHNLTLIILGTLHGAGSATSTGGVVGSTVGPSLGYIGRRLQVSLKFLASFWIELNHDFCTGSNISMSSDLPMG